MSPSSKPASSSRPAALSRTSPCAQGQAFSPCASTPTACRTPRADATAIPMIFTASWVATPVTGLATQDAVKIIGIARRRDRDPDDLHRILGREAGDRRLALAREARLDRDLGPQRVLPLEDVRGDVLGELLREQRLADHDLLDRLLEQLGETRHVHALLRRIEVDGALDVGGDELLV